MKTYKHNDLIYYYDTNLRLWAVYPENCWNSEAEYFNNRAEMLSIYPSFRFEPLKETIWNK